MKPVEQLFAVHGGGWQIFPDPEGEFTQTIGGVHCTAVAQTTHALQTPPQSIPVSPVPAS